ncbi:MAG: helix-turn-helix transcriptional regulator [Cytophagales bacterium]|nr:helix-turn-helix transcriptional regulator [Cytophagales bacterium]
MNKSAEENFDFIDDILEEISPVEMKKIEQRMLNAEKIRKAMDAKKWNNTMLLEALNMKSPSIITKWLSGTHNFTQDTLVEIGEVLGINFFETKDQKITIEFNFPVMENKTSGFDSFSSLDYILNSHQINLSSSPNNNCIEYQA